MSNLSCGSGTVRYMRVRIRSNWDSVVKGRMTYQDGQVNTTVPFDIWFAAGQQLAGSRLNVAIVGDTVSDSGAGSSCWTGYHVQENNTAPSSSELWDGWNTGYYDGSGDICDCHPVNSKDPWTRRIRWDDFV
jgi:hypothetical protein